MAVTIKNLISTTLPTAANASSKYSPAGSGPAKGAVVKSILVTNKAAVPVALNIEFRCLRSAGSDLHILALPVIGFGVLREFQQATGASARLRFIRPGRFSLNRSWICKSKRTLDSLRPENHAAPEGSLRGDLPGSTCGQSRPEIALPLSAPRQKLAVQV